MRYTFIGRNMDISEQNKEKITTKLDRIQKLFPADANAVVVLTAEKQFVKVEVTIPLHKRMIRAEVKDMDMLSAVDKAVDKLEAQIVKHKSRILDKTRHSVSIKEEFGSTPIPEDGLDDTPPVVIEKFKRFELKPMDAEEAVLQMELLGHNFFVFRNGETDAVDVVYKRRNGSYGLIESD